MTFNQSKDLRRDLTRNLMRTIILILVIAAVLTGCRKDSQLDTSAEPPTSNEPSSTANDTTSDLPATNDPPSTTSNDASAETDSDSFVEGKDKNCDYLPAKGQEELYSFPNLEGEGGGIGSIAVDDQYIYFSGQTGSSVYRIDKRGGGKEENIGGGILSGSIVVDEDYVYWSGGGSIKKVEKATKTLTTLSLQGHEDPPMAMAADDERLYLSGPGCRIVIILKKDGSDLVVSTQDVSAIVGGAIRIAVSNTHVYCSGGNDSYSLGKMYRVPKQGGTIEQVTVVPATDVIWGPQVGPMTIIGDGVFYITNYASPKATQYLTAVPADGGESTILATLTFASGPVNLHFDQQRNALYWGTFSGTDSGLAKYSFETEKLLRVEVEDETDAPFAKDDKYFYWSTRSKIYRLPIF